MNPLVAAAALSAGGNLLGGLFGNSQQASMQADMLKWQEKMWEKQNEYNLPINQRKRLTEGGFNPNLVYGNGSVSNTAGNVGTPPTPVKNQLNLGEAMASAISTFMQGKQLQQQQEQIDLAKDKFEQQKYMDYFRQANITADTLLKGMSTETGAFKLGVDKELRQNTLETAYQNLKNLTQQANIAKSDFEFSKTLRPFVYDTAKANTDTAKWNADITKSDAFTKFIEAQNFPAFQRIRLQKAVQEYRLANNADDRAHTDVARRS